MESKELLITTVCLIMLAAEISVHAMSAVNTDFERYLRTMNSSTTVPKIEERNENFIFAYLNYTYGEDKYKNYTEEKARYGEGQILNVQGLLVHVNNKLKPGDDRACTPNITGTLGNPIPRDQPWIALVRRGECNFDDKVKNVYDQGAVGVIIFNDKLVTNLEKMQIKDKNRNITAVITYKDVGEDMAAILDQGYEVVIAAITRGRSGVRPVNTLNKTSVLFVSISFIVLMIISLVWLIFYYIQRFRYLQSKDQQSRHLCSVTKRAIMKIPTKTGKGNDKDSDNDCCAICIEVYKSSDCIRVLPCNHEFHKACIDPWLIEHRTCPMCKLDVLKYYGYVFIGSEECVMELEGSYFDGDPSVVNTNPPSNPLQSPPMAASVTLQIANWERNLGDFNLTPPSVVYRHELPDRSQSSLSFVNNNQFFSAITNRLEAQHGIVRPRKLSRTEDTETLVEVVKKRRSHSADSRFSQGCAPHREDSDRSKMPSTSRQARPRAHSPQQPRADIKIQINGEGVEI